MVETESSDSRSKRFGYDICRIVGSSDTDFQDSGIHFLLQEDMESHKREVSKISRFRRGVRIQELFQGA